MTANRMAAPKFAAGDRVMFVPETLDLNVSRGLYTVVQVMPPEKAGYSYRVKSERDPHERVMIETQLAFTPARSLPT